MNNEFITSLTITIIVFIIKFLEMRLILKENKGLKILFKESLIVFIASMWFLISIKTNKDLLSLKVFGYSNLKIISILTFTAFVLGILIIAAINPITSLR